MLLISRIFVFGRIGKRFNIIMSGHNTSNPTITSNKEAIRCWCFFCVFQICVQHMRSTKCASLYVYYANYWLVVCLHRNNFALAGVLCAHSPNGIALVLLINLWATNNDQFLMSAQGSTTQKNET